MSIREICTVSCSYLTQSKTAFKTAALVGCVGLAGSSVTSSAWAGDWSEAAALVSADAELVVAIPSLSALSDAVAQFNQQMGLEEDELNSVASELLKEFGLSDGVDSQGAFVLVATDIVEAIKQDDEPPMVILASVSDYASFVQSAGGTAEGVTGIEVDGTDLFAKQLGSFAVISDDEQLVESYVAGGSEVKSQLSGFAGQYADQSLGMVYYDIEATAAGLDEALELAMDEIVGEAMDNPMMPFDVSGMVDAITPTLKTLIADSQMAFVGFDMQDGGIGLSMGYKAKPGSELASLMPGSSESAANNQTYLSQLPNQSYIFAGAFDTGGYDMAKVRAMVDDLLSGFQGQPMLGTMAEMVQSSLGLYEQAQGGAQVMYAPSAMEVMGGQIFKTLSVMKVDDSDSFMMEYQKVIEGMGDSMSQMMGDMMAMQGMPMDFSELKFDMTFTPDVMTVEGVSVGLFETAMSGPDEMMQMMGQMGPMGSTMNQSGYVASVDSNTLLISGVPNEALLGEGIKTIGSQDGLGQQSALANAQSSQMPKNSFFEFYFSLAGVAQVAGEMMMGDPSALGAPSDLPPISFGMGADQGEVAGRLYIPLETMLYTKNTVMDMMGGMGQISAPQAAQ